MFDLVFAAWFRQSEN